MTMLRIGELAKRAEVGIETIRFYERRGLLQPAERRTSGYRQYDEETEKILRFIRRAKELGFTLKEIKNLLDLRTDASSTRTEVRTQVKNKVIEIDAKISDLQQIRDGLLSLVGRCHGNGSIVDCPILDALQGTIKQK